MKIEHLTIVLVAIIVLLIISAYNSPEAPEVKKEEPKFVVIEKEEEPEIVFEEIKAEPKEATVKIRGGVFDPEELTIEKGTTVIWVNENEVPHKIADRKTPRKFYGDKIWKGESYNFTFDEVGEYNYYDVNFVTMQGKIIVKDGEIPITGNVIAVPSYGGKATGALILTAITIILSVYLVFYYERKHYL